MELTIGLFGTCGSSRWRDPFVQHYTAAGIPFFNPQVDEWDETMALEEARHLAEDCIVLFPVTSETYSLGSLTECGFSILQAIELDDRRDFVVMVEHSLEPSLTDPSLRKESLKSRALVWQHLRKLRLPNVYLVDTLVEMLEASLVLFEAARLRHPLERFNPHKR